MPSLSERPPGANADPPSTTPPALSLEDPAAVRTWLGHLREHVLDVVAAGADITRRSKRKRVRSRGEARRVIDGDGRTLLDLIDFAERALPPSPP
jgi:hypothetical protein